MAIEIHAGGCPTGRRRRAHRAGFDSAAGPDASDDADCRREQPLQHRAPAHLTAVPPPHLGISQIAIILGRSRIYGKWRSAQLTSGTGT